MAIQPSQDNSCVSSRWEGCRLVTEPTAGFATEWTIKPESQAAVETQVRHLLPAGQSAVQLVGHSQIWIALSRRAQYFMAASRPAFSECHCLH